MVFLSAALFGFLSLFGGVEGCNGGCKQYTNILFTVEKAKESTKHHCLPETYFSIDLHCIFSCYVPPLSTDVESCGCRKNPANKDSFSAAAQFLSLVTYSDKQERLYSPKKILCTGMALDCLQFTMID